MATDFHEPLEGTSDFAVHSYEPVVGSVGYIVGTGVKWLCDGVGAIDGIVDGIAVKLYTPVYTSTACPATAATILPELSMAIARHA